MRSPKKMLNIASLLIVAGSALEMTGALRTRLNGMETDVLFWAGVAVMLAGVGFACWKVRCPHCGRLLLGRGSLPEYCPHCGKKL